MKSFQINPIWVANTRRREIERLNAKWPHWVPLWGKRLLDRSESYCRQTSADAAGLAIVHILRPLWNCLFSHRFWIKKTIDPEPGLAAINYIRRHTTIPVPRPWFTFNYGSWAYVIMDRAPGVSLEDVFLDLTNDQRESYIAQLTAMLVELRALRSPHGPRICSADGGYVTVKSHLGPSRVGPFANEDAFNNASLDRIWPTKVRSSNPVPAPSTFCHDIAHPIVFTHGDIAPRNIMVKDGQITAIIDWETAGWFPAYCEFVETHIANGEWRGDPVSAAFRSYISRIMSPYQRELDVRIKWGAF